VAMPPSAKMARKKGIRAEERRGRSEIRGRMSSVQQGVAK